MAYRGGSGHDEIKEAYVYTYDRNINIKSERIVSDYEQNGEGQGKDITRVYTYDTAGRLTETRETDNSDGTAGTGITSYTYDKAGNRLTETKSGSMTSYSYNDLDQLTECRTAGETKTYSYDRNGNQTLEITKEGDAEKGRRSYAYDEADRLKTLTVKEDGRLTLTQENSYNGEGQRISKAETKLTEGPGGETAETTRTGYYYQDGAVLYTKDADGRRSSMNLLGTSANIIATSRGTGDSESWYLYNKDIRESTTSLTAADGSAAATYEYDDFGSTTVTSGADLDNEICYTGQIYDRSSGLYYYNARFYDSENARFLTQDTYRGEADQPDTLHLYAYCKNNPINYVDPSGHKYSAAKAVEYARKWAYDFNIKYKVHKSDCINYVSQCFEAGGLSQKRPDDIDNRPDYSETTNYWYSKKYRERHGRAWTNAWKESSSLTGVISFYKYWDKRSDTVATVTGSLTYKQMKKKIKRGDAVQVSKSKNKKETGNIITRL